MSYSLSSSPSYKTENKNGSISMYAIVKNKYTKMYLKYLFYAKYTTVHLHIYVLNKNTLQLYFWYSILNWYT